MQKWRGSKHPLAVALSKAKVTPTELAEQTGVDIAVLSRVLNGVWPYFSAVSGLKIHKVMGRYGVKLADLVNPETLQVLSQRRRLG